MDKQKKPKWKAYHEPVRIIRSDRQFYRGHAEVTKMVAEYREFNLRAQYTSKVVSGHVGLSSSGVNLTTQRFAVGPTPNLVAIIIWRPFRDPFDPDLIWNGGIFHGGATDISCKGDWSTLETDIRKAKERFEGDLRLMQIPVVLTNYHEGMRAIFTAIKEEIDHHLDGPEPPKEGINSLGFLAKLHSLPQRTKRTKESLQLELFFRGLAQFRTEMILRPLLHGLQPFPEQEAEAWMGAMGWSPLSVSVDSRIIGALPSTEVLDFSGKHGGIGRYFDKVYRERGDQPFGLSFPYGGAIDEIYDEIVKCQELSWIMSGGR